MFSLSRLFLAAALLSVGTGALSQTAPANPDSTAKVSFAADQAPIPFNLFREQRIFFAGKVNGRSVDMMLDSGASITLLDRKFADSLGIRIDEPVSVQGVSAQAQGGLARNVDIEVGSLRLAGATVLILDTEAVARGIGRPIPVVLGKEAIDAGIVTIDFPQRTIRFASREGFSAPTGARKLTLGHEGPLRTVNLAIAGLPEVAAVFDIGNGGAMHLSRALWTGAPELASLPWAETEFGGVGGVKIARKATLPYVDFAGERLQSVPAVLNTDTESLPREGANIGIEMLKPFVLTTDFAADTIYLQRKGSWPGFRKERAGVRTELNGDGLKLAHVSPQGPAATAGLKSGDVIIAIDGRPVGADFYASGGAEWSMAPAGTQVRLTRSDGHTATVTLRDYY